MPNTPKWEHGKRVHGYWIGLERVGHVGLSPRFMPPTTYEWEVGNVQNPFAGGSCETLRAAKRCVERAYAAMTKRDD